MPNSAQRNQQIIEAISSHPQGGEVRTIANQITDIVFDVRKKLVFPEVFKAKKTDRIDQKALTELIKRFRAEATRMTHLDFPELDDELYSQIILPLVTRLIDKST